MNKIYVFLEDVPSPGLRGGWRGSCRGWTRAVRSRVSGVGNALGILGEDVFRRGCDLPANGESDPIMAVIDLAFQIVGATIPLDHGYSLFAGLSRIVPGLHGDRGVGVHPIRGRPTSPGVLGLTEWSRLRIRLSAEGIAPYIAIAGRELDLDGHRIRVGIPQVESLVPAANLSARLVTFKHAMEAEVLLVDVRRELDRMEIAATPRLVPGKRPGHAGQPIRRVLTIKGRRLVAFPVCVVGLSPEESIRLQEEGLGGRRRMGCGVFCPFEMRTLAGQAQRERGNMR